MDIRKIKKLIELIKNTGVAEIEIKEGEESVRITLEGHPPKTASRETTFLRHSVDSTPAVHSHHESSASHQHTVNAPMVGTVYLSSTPGARPFVEIGQAIKTGDVICLIEAMKMFNQIEADRNGTITARLIDNGTPVEFGQPLFTIE